MSLTLSIPSHRARVSIDASLRAAAAFWFIVLVIGQIIFATSVAMFYGLSAVGAAARQYYRLRAEQPKIYNFDEDELNSLGYDLLRVHDYASAIRILQLNTEIYPKSGNSWDSLGEAYMDEGDITDAVENYKKSLSINPANRNAVIMIGKMQAGQAR